MHKQLIALLCALACGQALAVEDEVLSGRNGVTITEDAGAAKIWVEIAAPLPIAQGGTGYGTQQAAINSLAGAVTSGYYLRGNSTNALMAALAAADLTGTISSTVLGNSTVYIGSTAVALNRTTGALALTGITSIDGTAAGLSATLIATSGGTGQATYTVGDILVGGATNTLSKYADVAVGSVLTSGGVGVAPAWSPTVTLGASGTAGTLSLYPATGSKGHLVFSMVDNTGDSTTTITNAAQGGAYTYTIPNAGGSASFVMTQGTQTIYGSKTFDSAIAASVTGSSGSCSGLADHATYSGAATITNDAATGVSVYPAWVTANTGNLALYTTSARLSFVPSTGILSATGFSGPLTGAVTGSCSGSSATCSGLAASATVLATTRAINGVNFDGSAAVTVPVNNADDVTSSDQFVLFTATQAGNYAAKTSAGVKYHPSTGLVTATGFVGPLTGASTSCSGLAATATTLATPRKIFGVDFDGSAAIGLVEDTQAGDYTLVIADAPKIITMSKGTAAQLSIPTNASVAFPVGTMIIATATGAGAITIAAVTPGTTTIYSTGGTAAAPVLRVQYSSAILWKQATDIWYVFGDIK